jgi:hypothetical protein
LLPTLQFQQRDQNTVGLVQDALLSREENKRRNGFKISQGIYAIEKAVLIGDLLERPIHMNGNGVYRPLRFMRDSLLGITDWRKGSILTGF